MVVEPEDTVLVRRCLGGDRSAFGTLVERYQKPIFNVAWRMLGDREEAADISQTVFVRAFEKLRGYDPRYRFYSWIYRIAIHESIDAVKRRQRNDPIDERRPEPGPGPEEALGADELSRSIQRALMSIGPNHRSVLILRHFLDCSYRDMGEILGVPEKTVKSRLFTARQQLRARLERLGVTSR